MRRFAARAEFRRPDRDAPWALAGVVVEHAFWPSRPGVQRVARRLPDIGLLGWADLPVEVVAPDPSAAAAIALDIARSRWPAAARRPVPFASGGPDEGWRAAR